ncbi:MAG: hypothetical protein ACKPKO_27770, partial [Candidatus Fonsibacter sp.]
MGLEAQLLVGAPPCAGDPCAAVLLVQQSSIQQRGLCLAPPSSSSSSQAMADSVDVANALEDCIHAPGVALVLATTGLAPLVPAIKHTIPSVPSPLIESESGENPSTRPWHHALMRCHAPVFVPSLWSTEAPSQHSTTAALDVICKCGISSISQAAPKESNNKGRELLVRSHRKCGFFRFLLETFMLQVSSLAQSRRQLIRSTPVMRAHSTIQELQVFPSHRLVESAFTNASAKHS